jgi:hypothetical protein
MLWWLVGLWLLSPALVPLVWLLGVLAPSSRSKLSGPADKTPGAIMAFVEPAQPVADYQARDAQTLPPVASF